MKRSSILKWVSKFIFDNDLEGKIVELKIPEQERDLGYLKTPRTIFITGVSDLNAFRDLLDSRDLTYKLMEYESIEELNDSTFVDLENNDLSNNWRGRILRFDIDFDLEISQIDFERKFLHSFWRLIITRGSNNYFSKHNITPAFYYPGDSTGGHESFDGGVKNFIQFLSKASINPHPKNRVVDPYYDFVILFAVEKGGNPYNIIYPFDNTPPLLDDRKVRLEEFLEKYNEGQDEFILEIINRFKQNWS